MQNISEVLQVIIKNIEKVIIGKRTAVELVVTSLICNGHVLIEDVPGVGKTSMVSAFAKTISASFKRIQFTPDIMPSDITGFYIFNQKSGDFEYRQGLVMANIVLADEINRTSPKTQASLLEAMEEGRVTVDGVTYELPKPFMVLATENPVEYLGTYPLPEAQLDRFFMKISVGYPGKKDEVEILERFKEYNPIDFVKPIVDSSAVSYIQKQVKGVHVDRSLSEYIVNIISETRFDENVSLGVSPRGSLALYRASQAWALYNNRNYVIPEDIQKMASHVLSHRIILKQEATVRKVTCEDVLDRIFRKLKVPVL